MALSCPHAPSCCPTVNTVVISKLPSKQACIRLGKCHERLLGGKKRVPMVVNSVHCLVPVGMRCSADGDGVRPGNGQAALMLGVVTIAYPLKPLQPRVMEEPSLDGPLDKVNIIDASNM